MYRDLPMSQRLDKIGELLAKGVYLYSKKEKMMAQSRSKEKQAILSANRMEEKVGKNK